MDTARKHIDEITLAGGRACSKAILNNFLELGGEQRTRFTELFDESDLAELDSLRECPLTIQNYIEKAYELRVAVVGDRDFACKIDSQVAGMLALDRPIAPGLDRSVNLLVELPTPSTAKPACP
jgi:hypothetical protein